MDYLTTRAWKWKFTCSSLTVSVGDFENVGASHLLPEVEKENKRYSIISLAVGVLVAVFIVMSKR
jgi:hypothetical protein